MPKRKVRRKESLNLIRFRESVKKLGNAGIEPAVSDDDNQSNDEQTKVPRKRPRKIIRKEERKLKKMRKNAFQRHSELPTAETLQEERDEKRKKIEGMIKRKEKREERRTRRKVEIEEETKEKEKEEKAIQQASKNDDRAIKTLEKQLKMKKRKSKSLPQAFVDDGLDYILNALDGEKCNDSDGSLNFNDNSDRSSGSEIDFDDDADESTDQSGDEAGDIDQSNGIASDDNIDQSEDSEFDEDDLSDDYDLSEEEANYEEYNRREIKVVLPSADTITPNGILKKSNKKDKKKSVNFTSLEREETREDEASNENNMEGIREGEDECSSDEGSCVDEKSMKLKENLNTDVTSKDSDLVEDIYGRLRSKSGKVVTTMAYVPPALRAKSVSEGDEEQQKRLQRMSKQLKGLINRLSESNLSNICGQVESMYRTCSRSELSDCLSKLMFDACVSAIRLPERLITEHVLLVALLHSNVGSEIGAQFLQSFAERFDKKHKEINLIEDKELDNLIVFLAQLCNFKVVHCSLIFDVINILIDSFTPKDIDLLLILIKNVGFTLRREEAGTLKETILKIQSKCSTADISDVENKSRTAYMLEILMEIRNNNFRKIPSFDADHLEHQRKLIKNFQRAGVATNDALNISMDDLLNSTSKGRWWLVGSAWSGGKSNALQPLQNSATGTNLMNTITDDISADILKLAREQRMNTDIRRTIFCILMTSEDYTDAFTKLLKLGLKVKQEHEIIHVILDICLQEKSYNPFYALVAQKFCQLHRRHQMTIQFNMWDKFKELHSFSSQKLKNLSLFLANLLSNKAISLAVFKVIEFSELDKFKVKLMKRVMEELLLKPDLDTICAVFERVSRADKLQELREGLRLFMRHFLLRRAKDESVKAQLKKRVKIAERAMAVDNNITM